MSLGHLLGSIPLFAFGIACIVFPYHVERYQWLYSGREISSSRIPTASAFRIIGVAWTLFMLWLILR